MENKGEYLQKLNEEVRVQFDRHIFSKTEFWSSDMLDYRIARYSQAICFLDQLEILSKADVYHFAYEVLKLAGYPEHEYRSVTPNESELIAYDIIAQNLLIREICNADGNASQYYMDTFMSNKLYISPFSYLPMRTDWDDFVDWIGGLIYGQEDIDRFEDDYNYGLFSSSDVLRVFETSPEFHRNRFIKLPYKIYISNMEGVEVKKVRIEEGSYGYEMPCLTLFEDSYHNNMHLERLRHADWYTLGTN